MHQSCKGKQCYFGIKVHIGVDSESDLIHSVETTAANGHELNTAAERLNPEEKVVYGDSGHLGIEMREAFQGSACQFPIGMRSGQRRALSDTPEGRLVALMETAKTHLRARVVHPFRVIKCQFGFQKTNCRGLKKNDNKLKMLFALANLHKIRQRSPATA